MKLAISTRGFWWYCGSNAVSAARWVCQTGAVAMGASVERRGRRRG